MSVEIRVENFLGTDPRFINRPIKKILFALRRRPQSVSQSVSQ